MEKTIRPWGKYSVVGKTKLITMNPGKRISLQYHRDRDEFWDIIKGYGTVTIDDDTILAEEGKKFTIPKGVVHRVEAGDDGLIFLEIATGDVLEEDIVRLDDDYDRINTKQMVVICSGYFDPLHVGHLEYLKLSKELGDKLIVILNNDHQASIKKGKPFMRQEERKVILESLRFVDEVFISIDKDSTVCESILALNNKSKITVFAKGGDRFLHEIPEKKVCDDLNITIIDGLGRKIQSSSWLIGKTKPDKKDFQEKIVDDKK